MATQKNRVFIVDDDLTTRETLTEVLYLKGYDVESEATAEKTIEKIKDWPVDLFLIDLRMSGMGGIELLKKLDITNNTYEAIMITAYPGMDSAKEAMEYGAFSYISKPITYKDLAPLMKKALEMVKLKKLRDEQVKELEEKVEAGTEELEKEDKKLKLVEGILNESEERYRSLVEQSPVGIRVATLDGKVLYMNRKMDEIAGYSIDELQKAGLLSTYEDPKDRKKLLMLLNRDGMVNDFPTRLKRKNGIVYDAQLSVSKVHIGGQDLVQTICVDITERKKIEEALREKERKLSEQNIMLQKKNIALREVMDQLEAEKDRLGKMVNTNVDKLLLPLVEKLKNKCTNLDKTYIDLLEENVKELTSQFGSKMSDKMLRLTQKEIEMCNMIKQGLTSKEIAKLLDISHRTVETHRNNIRKKFGIRKQEVNLVTYLKNIA